MTTGSAWLASAILLGVASLQAGRSSASLPLRHIEADPPAPPSPTFGVVLKVDSIYGASNMRQCASVDIPPFFDAKETECDIVSVEVTNKGTETIEVPVHWRQPGSPFWESREALIDGNWSASIPVQLPDGSRKPYSGSGYHGGIDHLPITPGNHLSFLVPVERWRRSVASKLRLRINVSKANDTTHANETVTSNSFNIGE